MRALISGWLVVASCGRIDFDPLGVAGGSHDSPLVPGGAFFRDYDVAADGMFPNMTHPATVSAFRLDHYEVTVGQFRAFLDAGGGVQASAPANGAGAHDKIAGSGWSSAWDTKLSPDRPTLENQMLCFNGTWTAQARGNENKPLNCITWYDAFAYCIADGGYLPTAAEWGFAAAGGDEQRAYPWSNPPASLVADVNDASFGCFIDAATCIVPVGSEPSGDGKYGQSDLGGSMYEYTFDGDTGYVDPCVDCADVSDAASRAFRGGSWGFLAADMRTGHFEGAVQPADSSKVGIRCARAP